MIQKVYKVYPKSSAQAHNRVVQEHEALYEASILQSVTVRGSGGRLGKPVERQGYTEFSAKAGISGSMRACHMNPPKSFRLSENQESRATFSHQSLGAAYNKNGEPQDLEQFFKRALEVA